jgi:gamma-glutamyl-gamma-aminobutyrate hydrolase PuuD
MGIDFPILGVCQGFELLGIVATGDSKTLLKDVLCINIQQPVKWVHPLEEVRKESRTFEGFSQELI